MALSGTISKAYSGWTYRIEWSAKQDITGNYSDITCVHKLVCAASYDLYIAARTNSCTVGSSAKSFTSAAINTGGGSTITLGTTTHRVNHKDDGTATATITGVFNIQATLSGTYVSSITASGSITLNQIARVSVPSLSKSSVTMGDTITINTNRKSSSLTHKLTYTISGKDQSGTIGTGVGASKEWTVPDLPYTITEMKSLTFVIKCETFNGSTSLGSKTVNLTVDTAGRISAPTLSAASAKMGETITIYSNRKSSTFTHRLRLTINGYSEWFVSGDGFGASKAWTIPDLTAKINDLAVYDSTILCETWKGETHLGSKYVDIRIKVPDASIPSVTATSTPIKLGDSVTVKTNRSAYASNFKHKLTYTLGDASGTIGSDVASTKSWTIPYSLASQIPSAWSGTVTITCETYNGDRRVGTKTCTITVNVPDNETTKPSLGTVALSPVNSLPTKFQSLYVEGLTKIKAAYSATAPHSSLKGVSVTVTDSSGKAIETITGSASAATSGYIYRSGTITVKITATNTRGQTKTETKTVSFYEYSEPTLILTGRSGIDTILRCDVNGDASVTGNYLLIQSGREWSPLNGQNFCDLEYRIKAYDGTPFKSTDAFTDLLTGSSTDTTFNGKVSGVELDLKKTYFIELRVIDTVGNTQSFTRTIKSADVTFFLGEGGHSVGVGMYPTEAGFHVGMKSVFHEDVQGKVLGLGALSKIADGTDINECRQHGVYSIPSNASAKTMNNLPLQSAGTLRVYSGDGSGNIENAWAYIIQEYIDYTGRKRFTRNIYTTGTLGEWTFGNWLHISVTADYITEEGTDTTNGWVYRKWSSGRFEMWGKFTVTPELNQELASGVRISKTISIPTPFRISNTESVITGTSANGTWITGTGIPAAGMSVGFSIGCPYAFDGGTRAVNLYVTGRYYA
jgi:hypothetical protein